MNERLARSERGVLLALLAGACALRVWGLTYGLPHPQARPDEDILLGLLFGFDGGDPNPRWFIYPTFFLYLLYGYVKIVVVAGHALGLASWPMGLADLARVDPASLSLIARSFSVVVGTVNVAAVFALGRAVWNVRAGLIAAFILAVAFLPVRESHTFKPDAALALFNTVALLACARLERLGSVRAAVVAGLACGLAIGIKWGVPMLVPLVLSAVRPGWLGARRRLLAGTTVAIVTAVCTSPYMVLDWRNFMGWVAYSRMVLQYGGVVGGGFRYHAEQSMVLAHGWPFTLFAAGALVWNARRLLPLTGFIVASVVQLGLAAITYTRYATPILPAIYVVVAVAVERLTARRFPAMLRPVVTAGVLVLLLSRSVSSSLRFDAAAARPDTRLLARQWLEAHVPPGTTLLVTGAPWPFTFGDPVLTGYAVRRNLNLDPKLGIRFVITHEHPVPFSKVPEGFAALAPQLRLVATFTPFRAGRSPDEAAFEASDAFYLPLAGLDAIERGGPIIRVYAVTAAEGDASPDGARSRS
jgi:hypothetical protein